MTVTRLALAVATAAATLATWQLTPALADDRGQTLHLHVAPLTDVDTTSGFVAANADRTPDGQTVGFDVTTCRQTSSGPTCDVGLGLAAGMLLLSFTPGDGDTFTGVVTGGTGDYAHAKGTVLVHETGDGADATISLKR